MYQGQQLEKTSGRKDENTSGCQDISKIQTESSFWDIK